MLLGIRSWRLRLSLLFMVVAFVASGCSCEPTDVGDVSELEAIPKIVQFEGLQGSSQTKIAKIRAKVGSILISRIELTKGAPEYKLDAESLPKLPFLLEQGKTIDLKVTYTATAGESPSGTIRIESDATTPRDGVLEVRLIATTNVQQLVFTPNPVDFGELESDKEKEIEVIGENRGRATLNISQIVWNEKSSKGFTFPDGVPKAPIEVKPGDSFRFKVKYKPTTAKQDTGQMEFTCEGGCAPGDADPTKRANPYPLRFIGALAAPGIDVQPKQIDFGFVPSGTKETKDVTISNKGGALLKITKISMEDKSSGAFLVPRLTDVEVKPGESRKLPVTFAPSTGSKHQGVIIIESNDATQPKVLVRLFGQVSAPNIEVTPKVLDFGTAPVAKTLAFTVANSGDRPLIIQSMSKMVGTSSEFELKTQAITFPLTLQPNGFQSIQVTYTPANDGEDIGKILIISNDPDEQRVELELKAKGSAIPECDLVPNPTRLNFGLSVIGKSKVIPVKFFNQGGKDCLVSDIVIGTDKGGFPIPYNGPDVYLLPTPPTGCTGQDGKLTCQPAVTVKPGNSLTLDVSFAPQSEKQAAPPFGQPNFTGWLDVTSNGNPAKKRVLLDGLATRACVEVVPDNIDFGLVTVNCSSQKEKVLLYNTCGKDITVTKIGFSSIGANGFRITKAQAVPFNIPNGQSAEVEVAYRSTPPAQRQNAVLEIVHSITQQSPLSVPLIAQGTTTAEQTDTFKQLAKPKIDILFVIDNSCSMGDDQALLIQNFGSFIKFASTLQVDFHIGVTTTDVSGGGPFGSQYAPGELVGPANNKILTSSTPQLQDAFRQRASVGTSGGGAEAGLEGAKLALSHPLATTGANKGFLRKDASLSIITVSDEPDQSTNSVQFYINFFKNIKGFKNPDLLRFNAVIGVDQTTLKGTKCTASGGQGGATSNGRYLAVVQSTRGVVASICDQNWSNTLSNIGAVTFGLKKQFLLSRIADPTTIEVKVNGSVVAKGASTWLYEQTDNSIVFNTAPAANSTIQVKYKAICF